MANKIDSSNRNLIEEMIARGSSNADISKMTGVLKADIESFRQHPEKFSRKKSLEESLKTMYPTMPGYKTIRSTDKKDTQDEPKVIPEINENEPVPEPIVDLLDPNPESEPKESNDANQPDTDGSDAIGDTVDNNDDGEGEEIVITRRPTKLSADDVEVIVQRIIDGDVLSVIANDYGVDRMTIANIRHGRTWKHVVGDRLSGLPPADDRRGKKANPLSGYIDDIAKDIIKGYPIAEIAKKYRVSANTVRLWIDGKNRKNEFKDYDFSNYAPDYSLVISDDEIVPEYTPQTNKGQKISRDYNYTDTEIPIIKPNKRYVPTSETIQVTDTDANDDGCIIDDSIPMQSNMPLITVERTTDHINVALNVKLNCTITFNDNAIDIEWR